MCGIVGFVNLNGSPASPVILKKMTDEIYHRGPDGEGHWVKDNVAIGHRRLSIIDLTNAGYQPMSSKDGRYILSYNGEIYNFKELRSFLKTKGYTFNSNTDTEVVLLSLVHWGTEALNKFNGMFAFAFYDNFKKELIIARDRYGIKPLYYSLVDKVFSFGSEQKSIILQPSFSKKIDLPALMEYLTFQNIFTDRTLLKNINILPAGHFGVFKHKDKNITLKKFWDFKFEEPNNKLKKSEYIEELRFLFKQAVKRQLVSDVELGCYLSGGMDSGAITAIASKAYPNLKTFTCGFDISSASGLELSFDERSKAEAMSGLFKTEQYEMVLKAGDMERCLSRLAWHLEEPRVGQCYPNYYMAKLASKFVKVVLSGSGGDELFAGYPWRYYRSAISQNFEEYIDSYYIYWQRLIDNKDLHKIFAPVWEEVKHVRTRDIFRDVFLQHDNKLEKPEDYINHSLYFEAKTFLHGLLMVEDKMSMSYGLENRVPFLDNDLVDFAMRCPVGLKLNNLNEVIRINENQAGDKQNIYFQKTNDGKQILRDMLSDYVPDYITKGEKKGFSSPDASWFKGESIDFVRKKLLDPQAKIYDVLDYNATVSLIDDHLSGKDNRRLFIWSLLNVDEWMHQIN